MDEGKQKEDAKKALIAREKQCQAMLEKACELEVYAQNRNQQAKKQAEKISAAMDASAGEVPVKVLDQMSLEEVGDVVASMQSQTRSTRDEVKEGKESGADQTDIEMQEAECEELEYKVKELQAYCMQRKQQAATMKNEVVSEIDGSPDEIQTQKLDKASVMLVRDVADLAAAEAREAIAQVEVQRAEVAWLEASTLPAEDVPNSLFDVHEILCRLQGDAREIIASLQNPALQVYDSDTYPTPF